MANLLCRPISCFALTSRRRTTYLFFRNRIYCYRLSLSRLRVDYTTTSTMSREEEENAAELKFGDDFVKAKCLMNSEVAILLEHRCEQLKQMSDDLLNRIPQVFEKSLQYVQRFSRFSNQEAVKQVREVLSRYQLAEYELAVIGNLRPEAVDEALAVVPSLKTKGRGYDNETIEKMLNELALIKKFE